MAKAAANPVMTSDFQWQKGKLDRLARNVAFLSALMEAGLRHHGRMRLTQRTPKENPTRIVSAPLLPTCGGNELPRSPFGLTPKRRAGTIVE